MVASLGGFISMDVLGIFFGIGPAASLLKGQEFIGIGGFEAHGLAFILGVLLFKAEAKRSWHITAVAIHSLLGIANILMWGIFISVNSLQMGYITTAMHCIFVLLQLVAVFQSSEQDKYE
ncbi:hypothetical protein GS518_14640 [Leptospira interrogans]|uniref:Uncharacterized protein n=21 Tax=Leptospira interrogans TaxID=173 RepID=Q8F878_LEPIN|nr:hypothetical protein LA_0680 [Leptospira interrogans serovar Lai str. 56601]AER01361.1 hypothetical protein LIF_A0553 [Leptospira interrogans serovar Lai str. IPAV]ALE40900.1 hypothetical protein G436_3754 [Leptospira interrogans serovar Hardjo str. Norma]ARB97662.1 hypothetical protein A6J42_08680 [Leptospira interrogans serovar Copenhageni]ASP43113.1 hypothetical protein AMR47_18670 [Leptospira interrogans]EJP02503.1 hypothetical protein LEP1GSC007_0173 [Leptospira interrogans serovar Bul